MIIKTNERINEYNINDSPSMMIHIPNVPIFFIFVLF